MKLAIRAICWMICAAQAVHAQTATNDANIPPAQSGIVVRIMLPDPNFQGSVSIEQAIQQYNSVRNYLTTPLNDAQVSQVTWAGNMAMRAIAAAQAPAARVSTATTSFPFELYVCGGNGVFRYDPLGHAIDRLDPQDIRLGLANSANKMTSLQQAAISIVITAPKAAMRVRSRSAIGAEAGQVAYSMGIQAQAIGLGTIGTGVFDAKMVSKFARLSSEQEPIYILAVGVPVERISVAPAPAATAAQTAASTLAKRVLIVIPSKWFDEQEFFNVMDVLTVAKINIEVASSKLGYRRGMQQSQVQATQLLANVDPGSYDAIIFIGGIGTDEYYRNQAALNLARGAARQGKVLAAIGEAPAILANAGLLDENRARFYKQNSVWRIGQGQAYSSGVQNEAGIITASSNLDATLVARAVLAEMQGQPAQQSTIQPQYQREFGRVSIGQMTNPPPPQPQQQQTPQY